MTENLHLEFPGLISEYDKENWDVIFHYFHHIQKKPIGRAVEIILYYRTEFDGLGCA